MSTPSIQTLITQAQQVLNLKSSNEIRATLAAVLANANVGTPLNPNLTTQQLWDEFYEIVRQPSDDIMSIITDQMMRMVFSPPAPGGAGADKQVIFNDGGVLAGDTKFLWDKNANRLDVDGPVVITGDLTVATSTLKVNSTNNRVGIGTASPGNALHVQASGDIARFTNGTLSAYLAIDSSGYTLFTGAGQTGNGLYAKAATNAVQLWTNGAQRYDIDSTGVATWSVAGTTAMTLNSTGLGIGVVPSAWSNPYKCVQLSGGSLSVYPTTDLYISQNAYNSGGWKRVAAGYASQYIQTNSEHRFLVAGTSPTVDSAIAFTQAMTLDASGNLLVGTTAVGMTAGGVRLKNGGGNLGEISLSNNSGAADYVARFVWGSGATLVGNITVSSVATVYNTTSDYRLKESVAPLSGGLARVNALKPSVYNWKSDGSTGEGFLAHELAEVVPFAVTGEKDAVDKDGKIKPQGIDMSRVVPILVAAIQELTARVQTLEAR